MLFYETKCPGLQNALLASQVLNLLLNFCQWLNHCGPTGISTRKQGEDKD